MDVVAHIETLWASNKYSRHTLPRVESYDIDSALDTDADQFTVTLGDPNAQLMSLFRMNGEVRIQLSASYNNGKSFIPLLAGYADLVEITHDGTLTLTGRDLSAAAIDDTAQPRSWAAPRPGHIILQQAKDRGFTRFGGLLSHPNAIKPLPYPVYTDGSETVWAFWYRMIREKRMWIWTTSIGELVVNPLNYGEKPSYLFGSPSSDYPQYSHPSQWIAVEEAEEQKNTQTRIHNVWVYSDNGQKTFPPAKATDPTLDKWIKRPLEIIPTQANVHNPAQAMKQAQEEIFEGKVGEIEILIRIKDQGFIIQQNEVAILNLPKMGLSGEFFIVGVRLMNDGSSGAIQEIRLRDKQYALTKRIPLPPGTSSADGSQSISNAGLGSNLAVGGDLGPYFVEAAKLYNGPWDFALFLATLLAICDTESSFKNVREPSGGPEWYRKPVIDDTHDTRGPYHPPPQVEQWEKAFANSQHNKLNPFYPSREAGVGYFQLTSLSYKQHADSITGVHDEYSGGRWDKRANIITGGWVLAQKLQGLPVTDSDFWIGVQGYNGYPTGKREAGPYSAKIESLVNGQYLKQVQQAAVGTNSSDPTSTQHKYTGKLPEKVKKILHYAENQLGKGYSQKWRFGPNTFDCSGLAYMAYRAAGFTPADFGETWNTWGFWGNSNGGKAKNHNNLVFVRADDLSPGDMVFFDVLGEGGQPPQHMGIYYYDGIIINATSPNNNPHAVKTDPCFNSSWICMGGMRIKGIYPDVKSPNSK